jgi:hypothetical protein
MLLSMNPNPDDWRTRITALAGGDTLEAMLAFAARQAGATGGHRRRGWTVTVGWFRAPREYRAKVSRADVARTTEHAHPTDPAEALARALLTAMGGSGSC